MSGYKRFFIAAALAALCIVLSLVLRRHAPSPSFAWFFFSFGIGCIILCSAIPVQIIQYCGIALFSFCLALSGGEVYLRFMEKQGEAKTAAVAPPPGAGQSKNADSAEDEPVASGDDGAKDAKIVATDENYRTYTENGKNARPAATSPVIGYSPRPNSAVRAVDVKLGRLIYDVVYTINAEGRRITPEHPQAEEAVVFFGCSYVFGDAINDRETFPWQIGELLGERYQVFNFAFSGYGTHQFLALLEAGALDPIVARYKKTHVFFTSLAGHEYRAAGYWLWSADAPYYAIQDEKAVRRGVFSDKDGSFKVQLDHFFKKSYVYTLFFLSAHAWDGESALALQNAIFLTGSEIIGSYDGTDFTVLLWPGAENNEPFLHSHGIRTLRLYGAFPDEYQKNKDAFIVPGEGHPNALANSHVAAFMAVYIEKLTGGR